MSAEQHCYRLLCIPSDTVCAALSPVIFVIFYVLARRWNSGGGDALWGWGEGTWRDQDHAQGLPGTFWTFPPLVMGFKAHLCE